MALIKCEECGREISDKAESCPNCGCPINDVNLDVGKDKHKFKILDKFFISFGIIAIIVIIIIGVNTMRNNYASFIDSELSNNSDIALTTANSTDDDLNDKQIDTLKNFQGTWELNDYGDVYKFIFNGMKMQYYSKINSKMSEYTTSLKFLDDNDSFYLIEDNDSVKRLVYYIYDNKLTVGTYDGERVSFLKTISNKTSNNSNFIKKPQIGMTETEVLSSLWGKPEDINKTTTAYGVSEQWVYDNNRYVYLDDGIVTSIQE